MQGAGLGSRRAWLAITVKRLNFHSLFMDDDQLTLGMTAHRSPLMRRLAAMGAPRRGRLRRRHRRRGDASVVSAAGTRTVASDVRPDSAS